MKPLLLFVFLWSFISLTSCSTHHVCQEKDGIYVHLIHGEAKSVQFVSSSHQFKPQPLIQNKKGDWIVKIENKHREFKYFYLLNDEVFLPDCGTRTVIA